MLTIAESTQILKSHGITVFNCYAKRYSLRRDHPGYGTPESRSPLAEWFTVSDCSLGDVRAMAHAYEALSWPETRRYAEIARSGLRGAWAAYTGHRIEAERLGRAKNDWALPDDPAEAVAQIQGAGQRAGALAHSPGVAGESAQPPKALCRSVNLHSQPS